IRHRILHLKPDPNQVEPPLLAHYLKLDEAVTRHLLGGLPFSATLADACDMLSPAGHRADSISEGTREALQTLAEQALAEGESITFFFEGPDGSEKETAAEALARSLGIDMLRVRVDRIATGARDDFWRQIIRHAELTGALLYIRLADESTRPEGARPEEILEALGRFSGISILAGSCRPRTGSAVAPPIVSVTFDSLGFAARQNLWQHQLECYGMSLSSEELEFLSARFSLTASQIRQAVSTAIVNERWRFLAQSPSRDYGSSQPTVNDLAAAARAQSGHELLNLARKIEPRYGWADIVLPADQMAQLDEICAQAKLRHVVYDAWGFDRKLSLGKGLNVLFCGPPGTGKTMAAEVISTELSLDLYRIDLSQVVNKYIGETEKNLDRIFRAAENSNAILFFDEADALFGKRSQVRDSHDRYANIEISYLLQKMEEYLGISILATNLRQNLDEAFVRRLHAIVEFPFPDEEHRRKIWQNVFPKEAPVQEDICFDVLAREIRLAGGNIKNMALAAAFSAAAMNRDIGMDELMHAAYREHQKIGCSWAEIATLKHG
ncbi:MAG TPA: ATP-binding protein, partial [Pyrinomonadaceae bacterium]|nr:ATP-binding protein [Pyrinomonadaceae bacterium]